MKLTRNQTRNWKRNLITFGQNIGQELGQKIEQKYLAKIRIRSQFFGLLLVPLKILNVDKTAPKWL